MRRPQHLGLAAFVGLALVGCANDAPVAGDARFRPLGVFGGGNEVTIVGREITFDVTELEFNVGDEVVFTFDNQDPVVRHSLHIEGAGGFDAATEILAGPVVQTLEVEFTEPGEYVFFCDTHPNEMRGTITVSG